MECKFNKLLNKYLDKELSVSEYRLVDEHLLNCPACSGELRRMVLLKESFANNKVESNAEFFWQQLKKRIAEEEEACEGSDVVFDFGEWARRIIPVPVVIAVLAAIFLGTTAMTQDNLIDRYIFENTNGSAYSLKEEVEKTGNPSLNALLN